MPPKRVFQADPTNCRIRSKRSVILINESGLYALILSSKLDRRLCRLAMDIQCFQEDGVVETVKYGLYRKLVRELP